MTKKTVLEIKDEVNIRFNGLDGDTRRKLKQATEYFLPHARYTPAFKLGRWDGKVSFCDIGGRSYINILDRLLPIVAQCGYEVEIQDHRQVWDLSMEEVDTDTFSHITWPDKHPMAGQPITLRDYQVEAVNRFLSNPQCLQQIATGAGKTLITAALSSRVEKHGRSIVIVPNKDLVTQTARDYTNLGLDVGVLYGDDKQYDKTHTICTWQSLDSLQKDVNNGLRGTEFDTLLQDVVCVMVDECFAKGTPVLTPDGYVSIESLREGDIVVNYNEESKIFKHDTVVKLHTNLTTSASEKMYELVFDNASVIRVTGNHKFLTHNRGWVRADELTESDEIVDNLKNYTSA